MFGRCPAVIRGLAGSRKFLFGSRRRTITGRSSDGLRSASERCHLCKLHARIFFTGVVRYRKNCKNHRCAPDYPLSPDTGRSLWPKHKFEKDVVRTFLYFKWASRSSTLTCPSGHTVTGRFYKNSVLKNVKEFYNTKRQAKDGQESTFYMTTPPLKSVQLLSLFWLLKRWKF